MAEISEHPSWMSPSARDQVTWRNLSKSESATTPVTPPTRFIPSASSTPGSTFGQEQDAVILELNSRYIKAGIEGESHPQCRYDLTPLSFQRVDSYRQYLPNYTRPKEDLGTWGAGYEFWKNDVRSMNLGLFSDNLERIIREINNKHLLVDAGTARLVLVVPSLLPHPVLAVILETIFERWAYPSITLLPTPVTVLVAAGLRSGIVVDIDWEETVVTAVYEYREVKSCRTTRAMRLMSKNIAALMRPLLQPQDRFDLEFIEDVLRVTGEHTCANSQVEDADEDIMIDWPTDQFSRPVVLSKRDMQTQMVDSLLGHNDEPYPDDEEMPIQRVIYDALLALPPDIRGVCMSRMVFAGAGSENKPLVSLILNSFKTLLESRGWTNVRGGKPRDRRTGLSELAQGRAPADARHDDSVLSKDALAEERHLREKEKNSRPDAHGILRQIDSLGAWSGASLITALKVKSFVEIQRDRFLTQGLSGAVRELDISVVPQQIRGPMTSRSKAGERTSWTLSGWA